MRGRYDGYARPIASAGFQGHPKRGILRERLRDSGLIRMTPQLSILLQLHQHLRILLNSCKPTHRMDNTARPPRFESVEATKAVFVFAGERLNLAVNGRLRGTIVIDGDGSLNRLPVLLDNIGTLPALSFSECYTL
jgi:hypothetical protein